MAISGDTHLAVDRWRGFMTDWQQPMSTALTFPRSPQAEVCEPSVQ